MTYDFECPICGKMNYHLYLEETQGWMECAGCLNTVGNLKIMQKYLTLIPRISEETLVRMARQSANKTITPRNRA